MIWFSRVGWSGASTRVSRKSRRSRGRAGGREREVEKARVEGCKSPPYTNPGASYCRIRRVNCPCRRDANVARKLSAPVIGERAAMKIIKGPESIDQRCNTLARDRQDGCQMQLSKSGKVQDEEQGRSLEGGEKCGEAKRGAPVGSCWAPRSSPHETRRRA